MSTTTEAPPLSDEEIEATRRWFASLNLCGDFAGPIMRVVTGLLDGHATANQRIRELEQAAEWRPTHRGIHTDSEIELLARNPSHGTVEFRLGGTLKYCCVADFVFDYHFEPLPELEGEKA